MTAEFKALNVRNSGAARDLVGLCRTALTELLGFGEAPILLAECPSKYNRTTFDDYWYAVQVGRSSWLRSHFFRGTSEPCATERTQFVGPSAGGPIPDCLSASETITAARQVLKALQDNGWRELIESAFESNEGNGTLISLVHCFGQPWVYRSRPNCGGGDTWTWDEDGQFYHVANATDRLDESVGRWYPLATFNQIDACRFSVLTKQAKQYFAPSVKTRASHEMLASSLFDVVSEVRDITSELVIFRLTVPYFRYARFVWKEAEFEARVSSAPAAVGEKLPAEVILLDRVLRELQKTDWRNLFGAAYGCPLAPDQALELFVTRDDALLLRGNSAFRIAEGTLTFAGLCDWHGNKFPKCKSV